jgi:hypothetical protein
VCAVAFALSLLLIAIIWVMVTNVTPIKSTVKVSGAMSPEIATWVNKFLAHNAHRYGSHGPMTVEVLLKMLRRRRMSGEGARGGSFSCQGIRIHDEDSNSMVSGVFHHKPGEPRG